MSQTYSKRGSGMSATIVLAATTFAALLAAMALASVVGSIARLELDPDGI